MSNARNLARLIVDSNGDVDTSALGNVPPSDDASALTTGTLPIARIADGDITAGKLASTLDLTGKTVTLPSGTGGKIIKVTNAINTNTRTVWGQNTGTLLSGIDFRYPTDSRQTIAFTKDNGSSVSDIIIHFTMAVGGTFQVHCGCLWKSDESTWRMIGYDGHRNGTYAAPSSDLVTGSYLFTGLAAGSHTFYWSLGRRGGSSANMEWRINPDNADADDKGPDPWSQVLVYEVAK